jgi:hypothetical protein
MIRKIEKKMMSIHLHHSDVERLQHVMLQNGYDADYDSAAGIWQEYSDDNAAGWLSLPEDDDKLWETVAHRVEREAQ